jgi:hypothetical protein
MLLHDKILLAYFKTTFLKANKWDKFVFSVNAKILLAYCPAKNKCFGVFSDYDKIVLATYVYSHNEIRIRKSEVTLSTLSSGFKGTV